MLELRTMSRHVKTNEELLPCILKCSSNSFCRVLFITW